MRGLFVLLATSLFCSSVVAADLASVNNVKMRTVDTGIEISVSVTAPRKRSCHDLDLLVRLGREDLEAGKSILDDLVAGRDARRSLQWTLLSLQGDSPERSLYVHITEQSPISAGKSILLLERKDRIFVRYRLPNVVGAGQRSTIKFTLPFADQDSSRPLKPIAMVIGYWMNDVSTRDFTVLPAKGVVGLTVLMRSAGLEGFEDRKARRKQALRENPGFAARLAALVASAIKEANESKVPTLGVAAAVWLLPTLSGAEFIKMAVGAMASPNRSSWAVRFKSELAAAEKDDYLLWIAARQGLEPREGKADVLTRLLAMAAHYLESADIPMLMDALAELEKAPDGQATVRSFAVEAGAALLEGITSRPQAEVEKLITRLGEWRASNAASELLEEQVLTALIQRIGRPAMLKALLGMTEERMPVEVLQFMGHESELSRKVAYEIVSNGGLPALVAVSEELIRRGYPPGQDVDAKAFEKNPELLKQLCGRLQGILLVRFADIFVELADRLHVLEGDCLMHLEQARREIHPQLLLPEPLWSQCRAMRAVILLGKGKLGLAEKLINAAMKASGDDRRVKERYRVVRMARARRLFDEENLVAALAIIDEIDPHHKTQMILGIVG